MKKLFSLLGVAVAISFSSCDEINTFVMEDHQGAFILNKGSDKSNVSYYNYERETVTNNYFQLKNSSIGMSSDAHTMAIRKGSDYPKGKAFIVYPEDNNISMINLNGFVSAGDIEEYTKPTDILLVKEDVAYISATGSEGKGMVYEYDFKNSKELMSFEVAKEPLKMISSGKHLYVACKNDEEGAKVFVIDMTNSVKVDTVDLAYANPIDMVVDIDRNVWVYCAGESDALVKLNYEFVTETLDVDTETERDTTYITNEPIAFELGSKTEERANPLTISEDGRILYYVYGKLSSNSVYIEDNEDLSQEAIVSGDYQAEAFNSINYDSRTNRIMALASNGKLVVLKDYGSTGWSNEEVYDIGSNPLITTFNY